MLTPCPCCGKLTHLKTEDAMSPVERDRLCARCFWAKEVDAGKLTLASANAILVANGHQPITEVYLGAV